MGTVLSFSPRPSKHLYEDINLNHYTYEMLNGVTNRSGSWVAPSAAGNQPAKISDVCIDCSSTKENSRSKLSLFPSGWRYRGKRKTFLKNSTSTKLSSEKSSTSLTSDSINNNPFNKSTSCYNLKSNETTDNNVLRANNNNNNATVNPSGRGTRNELLESARISRVDTVRQQSSNSQETRPKKTVIQATTSELLRCLGEYLCQHCGHVLMLESCEPALWLRAVDRALLIQGWQDIAFINPATTVFLFLIVKGHLRVEIAESQRHLHSILLTCLYLAYSYMGNEISYPLKPFLLDESERELFWDRCLQVINEQSEDMLKINSDPAFFTRLFAELKSYGP